MVVLGDVEAVQKGFQSADASVLLGSLAKLIMLLREAGFEERWKKLQQLQAHVVSHCAKVGSDTREAIVEAVGHHQGAEQFILSALDDLRSLAAQTTGDARVPAATTDKAAGQPTPQTAPLLKEDAGQRHVVLNCANIGCSYGGNVLKRATGRFDWAGVEKAFQYYAALEITVHAIIGQRLLTNVGTAGLTPKLKDALVVIPSRDEMLDNDDLSTIMEAAKWKCQFVDNDNYRDWSRQRLQDQPAVSKWFRENKSKLHVPYYFDRLGNFTPMKDPTSTQEQGSAGPPCSSQKRPPCDAAWSQMARASSGDGANLETPAAKRLRTASEPKAKAAVRLQLPRERYSPPRGAAEWKVMRPTPVWLKPVDGADASQLLRNLKVGDKFKQIGQRPSQGPPEWLALAPRGWVKVVVSGTGAGTNVEKL